jgi:hypothetical membrane protein
MLNRRLIGFIGIGTWVWFWLVSFLLGALRPSYSPIVNTLSELGVRGTSNAILWNVFGFMVTGVLVAVTGRTIARAVNPKPSAARTVATILLVVVGLAVVGQGVMPADMSNGRADVTSPNTVAHFICSVLSGLAWIIGVLVLLGPMKRNHDWRGLWIVSLVLVLLTLVASFTLRGLMPDGLAQRTGNAIFCAWYVLMSLKLVRLSGSSTPASASWLPRGRHRGNDELQT